MDDGSRHKANALVIPDKVVCLFFPPYSPERNPSERLWQDVKEQAAWVVTAAVDELEPCVEMIITP